MTNLKKTQENHNGQNSPDNIEIIDLAKLYRSDQLRFTRLFDGAHRIYCDSFPEYEQESEEQILDHIGESDLLRGDAEIGPYNYLALLVDGTPQGMHSLDFLSNDKSDFVAHLGTLAIGKSARGKGLSSRLVDGIFERIRAFADQENLEPLGSVFEGDLFNFPGEVDKYAARLRFHHYHLGAGAAVTIDEEGCAKLVPYGCPGIIKDGQPADIIPFIMAVTPFANGAFEKISAIPGTVISPSGEVIVDKNTLQRITPETIMGMQRMIYDIYARHCGEEDRKLGSLDQIASMGEETKKALQGVEETYLIPIMDTIYVREI